MGSISKGDNLLENEQHFHVGRMSLLFSLVAAGKLTLDDAADLTGMSWGDAYDMLQGWEEAQRI